jgi:hypothetical protein
MIDVAAVEFTLESPPLGEGRLAVRANSLFDTWDEYLSANLPLSDYYLRFELAEGSLKGRGKVAATALALYAGIATFGSFTSGVHEIVTLSRSAGQFLISEADHQCGLDCVGGIRGRKSAAQLTQLENLFVRVRRGELTPDEATALADRLLEVDEPLPPAFRKELHSAIQEIPRRAKQLDLELGYPLATDPEPEPPEQRRKPERQLPPPPTLPPPAKFRVEVWRESKKGRRHVTIEPL